MIMMITIMPLFSAWTPATPLEAPHRHQGNSPRESPSQLSSEIMKGSWGRIVIQNDLRDTRDVRGGDQIRTPPSPREPLQTPNSRLRCFFSLTTFQPLKDLFSINCRGNAADQRAYSANDTTLNRLKSALVSDVLEKQSIWIFHAHKVFSIQLVDLHVYLVPSSSWETGRNLATQVNIGSKERQLRYFYLEYIMMHSFTICPNLNIQRITDYM